MVILDDDRAFGRALARGLRSEFDVDGAQTTEEAERLLTPLPDLVLLDLRLSEEEGASNGLDVLADLRERFPSLPVVMVTGHPDVDVAVEAMRRGAVDFVQKGGIKLDELGARLARALEHGKMRRRLDELESELYRAEPREMVGRGETIDAVRRTLRAIGQDSGVTALITGESGTGKELAARMIHAAGARRDGPFVPITLNTISPDGAEVALFGRQDDGIVGLIERAHGGVLFFDEIAETSLPMQGRLLRFLEEREFCRSDSSVPVRVDVQVVAATNADLETRVLMGSFRQDLYYRLRVQEVEMPPLRSRLEDVEDLVAHFLLWVQRQGKRVDRLAPSALSALRQFSWPGNVRELRNAIEVAAIRADGDGRSEIGLSDLPSDVRGTSPKGEPGFEPVSLNVNEALARTEIFCVDQALSATHGKKTEAWRILGYNDRFALRRRVLKALEQYPGLARDFPAVAAQFR